MSTFDWPLMPNGQPYRILSQTFQRSQNVQTFTNPIGRTTQRIKLKGSRWTATYTLTAHTKAEIGPFLAFLMNMQGGVSTFYGRDFDRETPQGIATGIPLVMGSGQTGTSLITDGWTPSITGILKAGDYIQVGTQLRMVIADANSDSSGIATLQLDDNLTSAPADNAPIITNKASCVMRLVDSTQDSWQTDQNSLYTITIQAIETFE